MDTRWTYRKKHDENGTFTKYRSRHVAKGFTQILSVNYFESFSPMASFVTIRTQFVLTALPMFKVYQYDVELAFIQSTIDPNHPPVYCTPAEGYEDRRQYVYQLHKHLYGMKDFPRGWSKLFVLPTASHNSNLMNASLSKSSPTQSPANPVTPSLRFSTHCRMSLNAIVSTKTALTKAVS
jgi:hypothetical protein